MNKHGLGGIKRSGYSDFYMMRSCMEDIESYETIERKGIPYRYVIYMKPGFYSMQALPQLKQWSNHFNEEILWTAIGPKKPRWAHTPPPPPRYIIRSHFF